MLASERLRARFRAVGWSGVVTMAVTTSYLVTPKRDHLVTTSDQYTARPCAPTLSDRWKWSRRNVTTCDHGLPETVVRGWSRALYIERDHLTTSRPDHDR
jgi:hypothetical protein